MNRKQREYKFPCPRCGNQGHDRNSENCPALRNRCDYCKKPGHVKECCYQLKYKKPPGELVHGSSSFAHSSKRPYHTNETPDKKRRYDNFSNSTRKIPPPLVEGSVATTNVEKKQKCTIGGKQITFIVNPTLSFNVLPLAAYEALTDLEFVVKTYDRVDMLITNTLYLGMVTASVQTSGGPPVTTSFFIQDSVKKCVMLTKSLASKMKNNF